MIGSGDVLSGLIVSLIGQGKINLTDIKKIIKNKDRNKSGITAPAYGLYLKEVIY